MNSTLTDELAKSRESARAFGQHYDYDVSYMEALMEASPGAYRVFEGAMPMSQYHRVARMDLMAIARIAALRAEDCGPCLELSVKMAREAGMEEAVIRGALRGGQGLSPEQLEVFTYATAVAKNEPMEPDLIDRLQQRWGKEAVAELAVAIVGAALASR